MNLKMDFKELSKYLKFKNCDNYVLIFENGYGASIVKNPRSIGCDEDLWALGVMRKAHVGENPGYHLDDKYRIFRYLTRDVLLSALRTIHDFPSLNE